MVATFRYHAYLTGAIIYCVANKNRKFANLSLNYDDVIVLSMRCNACTAMRCNNGKPRCVVILASV